MGEERQSDPARRVSIGQRVMVDNNVGTVRWRGFVKTKHYMFTLRPRSFRGVVSQDEDDEDEDDDDDEETPEALSMDTEDQSEIEVLGIEWDRWSNGTHNGTVGGVEYFKPYIVLLFDEAMEAVRVMYGMHKEPEIRKSTTTGPMDALLENHGSVTCSFVKECDVKLGISMAEAVRQRYLTDETSPTAECELSSIVDGKKVVGHEFVGRTKAVEFYAQTCNLHMLGLQESRIDRLGEFSEFRFPKVRHLFLTNNLIYEWSVVTEAIANLPNLDTLCVSGNVFTSKDDAPLESPKLTTVVMNKTLVRFDTAVEMLCGLPNLKSLSLCANAYADLGCASQLERLHTLDVSGNSLWNWYSVLRCIKSVPTLKKLVLTNNKLCNLSVHPKTGQFYTLYECAVEIADEENKTIEAFHGLEELYLDNNYIYEWGTVSDMAVVFRHLKVLRLQLSAVNKELTPATLSLHRQVLIAIFPELKVLNGSDITPNERTNAERYYLALAPSDCGMFKQTNHPAGLQISHSERLEQIHGKRDTSTKCATHNFASRLISLLLVPDGDSDSYNKEPIRRQLPATTTVREVKSLCSRLFALDLSDISLVYNDGRMPLCERMDDEDAEIQHYGLCDGDHIRVQLRSTRL